MAIAIAPFASVAARYGIVVLTTYAFVRRIPKAPRDQIVEDKLDQVEEGLSLRRENEQINLSTRFRRLIRLGKTGPGVEVEGSVLARLRFKRIKRK